MQNIKRKETFQAREEIEIKENTTNMFRSSFIIIIFVLRRFRFN